MNTQLISTVLAGMVLTSVISVSQAKEEDMSKDTNVAIFAGGCFWCMQPPYDQVEGVTKTVVGYTGGKAQNAQYDRVSQGNTGHLEAIQVTYDPARTDYKELLRVFWQSIDPTDPGGQFADRGTQYETAIFYHDEEQRKLAEWSKEELASSGRFRQPIATKILPAQEFYPAEDYHQGYYRKNSLHYKAYSAGSGRKGFVERAWKDKVPAK